MADPLSARAKFTRAEKHRRELNGQITRFRERYSYTLSIEDDPGAHESVHEIRYGRRIPAQWQPILGDCLHNYRSALDHLVWEVCRIHSTRNEHRQFPINVSRDQFLSRYRNHIGVVPPTGRVATAFEALQPYKRANRPAEGPARHPLWLLHRLDILDKHRQMLEAATNPVISIDAAIPGYRSIDKTANRERFAIPYAPGGPVHVDPEVAVNVMISKVDLGKIGNRSLGIARDLPLDTTILEISNAVDHALSTLNHLCDE